jgi:uncharacterized protein (TIGR03437 family)
MYDRQSRAGRFLPLFYFMVAFALLSPIEGQQITSVVSAANDQNVISPNSIATIFGVNLAQETASATLNASGALPDALGGTSVSIGGQTAPLLYVSPQQINFLVPANTSLGTVNVSVNSAASQSPISGSVSVASVSPGVFTIPCLRPSRGAVLNGVTNSLEPFQAITPQNAIPDKRTRLSLFGTGLRYAGNATFNPSVVNVANAITAQATDSLGVTRTLPVEYAGPAPDYLGLDQVNVVLPPELQDAGLVYLRLLAGNATSNSVSVIMSKSMAAGLGSEQNFNIMTVAGSGVAGYAGDLGSAIRALLQKPTGVVLDSRHNLYIASGTNHVVQMVSTDGVITAVAGTGASGSSGDGGPAIQALLRDPVSLVVDPSGNLYVADPEDNKIRRIAANGTISTFAGTGVQGFSGDGGPAAAAELSSPSAVAVDPYGAIVIADTGNNRVRRVTSDGVIDTIAGTGKANFSGDGGPAYLAGLNAPDSVAVGADGTTYVADEGNQRIRRIFADGGIDSLMASGLTPIFFQSPIRLAVDANQQLFISDSPDARIQVMGSACQLNPVAGTGIPGFAGDGGLATGAQVNGPSSLAPDTSGDVYFADSNNNRIRRLYQGGCDSPANIVFNPEPAMTGMTVNGLVRLSCPAAQDTALALSGNGLDLPGAVSIASGQTSGSFSFRVPSVDMTTGFPVTASNPQYSAAGTLFAEPAGTSNAGALSMAVEPSSQIGGGPVSGIVTLAGPAPAGGTQVSVASNDPAAKVAGDALIPEGQRGAEFAVITSPVAQPATATITGNSGGVTTSTPLSILTGGLSTLGSLSIAPSSVTSGQTATGTVTLASAAPASGVQVNLTSSNAAATVPPSVTIPAGQTTGTFPISTSTASSPSTATITASSANNASATLTVNPASSSQSPASGTIASFSVSPSSVTSGQTATGTVTLASAAPASGVQVNLTSSNAAATVPASVTIPAGQTTGTFPVSTSTVSSPSTATITASSANNASATLSVNPASSSQSPASGTITSFSVSPSSVTSGQTATGSVTLASAAPASGVQVNLASSNAAATVPASVTIPAGQTTGTFPVSTSAVSSPTTATITASSANTASATLTVNPAAANADCVGSVTFSRSEVIGGNPVSGTVALTSPAPAGGQPVSLSSSSASAGVPSTVTVPAGQSSTGFTVSTKPVLSTQNPVISGSTGACAGSSAALTILPSL